MSVLKNNIPSWDADAGTFDKTPFPGGKAILT